MLVKYHQGRFWLMRTHRATGGTYLVVHYSNGWTTLFLLFLGVLQGYIWYALPSLLPLRATDLLVQANRVLQPGKMGPQL